MHAAVKRNRIALVLASLCALLLSPLLLSATVSPQIVTGSLFGTITEASGGRLPGVT